MVTTSGVRFAVINLQKLKIVDYDENVPACVRAGIVRPESYMTSFSCDADGSLVFETILTLPPDGFLTCTRIEKNVYSNQLATMVDLSSGLSPAHQTVHPRISFVLGVVPFLTRFGLSLCNLSLDSISDVDLFLITACCPLLKIIKLKRCRFVPLPSHNIPMSFIEEIEFDGTSGGQITGRGLLHLLLSPKLTNISIVHGKYLSDRILNFVFSKHRFQHLKRLKLFGCPNISNETFKSIFLIELNVLRNIKICGCSQLNLPTVRNEWNELVSRKNFDLKIAFL